MTFAEWIAEKGVKTLSLATGWPEGTIYAWSSRGWVPRDRWDRLLELYPKLTYRQLRDMEIESKASKQRA